MSNETEIKPPIHVATDWNCYLKHLANKKFQISSYFDKENWKSNKVYRMRVSHIYDPSHFWVVSKESEVDALHKYLHDFYSKYEAYYKIPSSSFKINMYCITYTEGAFYRSIIVNIPLAIEKESWAFALLVDFGYMAKVSLEEIYFMTEKMYDIPQFAIRATLSGLGPVGSITWSSKVVSRFNELVSNKILFCQMTNKNCANKVLFLRLGEFNWQKKTLDSINEVLVMERLARQMTVVDIKEIRNIEKKKSPKRKNFKLPFLTPTFDEIEKGACIDSVVTARYLDEFTSK